MSLHAATRSVPPPSVWKAAVAFRARTERPLARAYDHAVRIMVENYAGPRREEGIGAFLEKHRPRWSQLL